MDSHLSKDSFCELVVRSNGHVEDAKDPWKCLELSSSFESLETAVNRWEEQKKQLFRLQPHGLQ